MEPPSSRLFSRAIVFSNEDKGIRAGKGGFISYSIFFSKEVDHG